VAAYIEEWRRSSGVSGGSRPRAAQAWEEERGDVLSAATDWGSAPMTLAVVGACVLPRHPTVCSIVTSSGSSTHAQRQPSHTRAQHGQIQFSG
jgi:hypothetical protein